MTERSEPSPAEPPLGFAEGHVLDGRYRLVDRLGRGGFGDVWRAAELLPDGTPFRDVALKLLVSGGDSGDWAEEAKLLASFRHPALVTIYAAGILAIDPPQRFVAMELLEGRTLADEIRVRGRLPWRRVLRWACSVAAALDVIHLAGVVHLDLKPANLFLANDGAVKVLDFGISRRAGKKPVYVSRQKEKAGPMATADAELGTAMFLAEQDASDATQDMLGATRPAGGSTQQAVVGTPGFMAPEVLELAEPTAAADAYALAVVVVQLATGHLPHAADDEPSSWEDPTAVSAWLDGLRRATLRGTLRGFDADPALFPRGLAALVRRLLSVDPLARAVVPGKLGEAFEGVWQRPHGVPDPPYPGLAPYPPEAEGLIFGRDDDIARLGRELEYEPAIVLQGVRGVGKTSLALAGLVPYLALRGVDGKDDWIAARVAPGADPDAALAKALAAIAPELESATAAEIAAHLAASPVGVALFVDPLDDAIAAPAEKRSRLEALLAAIAAATPSLDRAEGGELAPAVHGTLPGLRLLAALSEEHTAALLASGPLGASLRSALRFVGPPAPAAVRDIVGAPAHFAGSPLTGVETIAAEVQRELRAGGTRLPYVAIALRTFWDAAAADARKTDAAPGAAGPPLRIEHWKQIGGVEGAIARHADGVVAGLPAADRALAGEILLQLSATDGTPVGWDEGELVATFGSDAKAAEAMLAVLEREHLVRRHHGAVDIGHAALLVGWERLTSARLREMARLLFLERLREARLAFQRSDDDRGLLLHGALLDEVRAHPEWLARGLTPADRAFVEESRRRARVRTLGRAAAVLAAGLAVGIGVLGKQAVDAAKAAEAATREAAIELERTAELAAKSRRTEDPYRRAAFAVAAMERASQDGMLPLDLAAAVSTLARADFLTLDRVSGPEFPWDDRWMIGQTSGGTLALVDFHPKEPEVIENLELDADLDAESAKHFKKPHVLELRPHVDPIAERAMFAFDTAFATRSVTGEVKVFRLRDDGTPALAAIAPMRCAGVLRLAAAAPVIACSTEHGVARWDLRRAGDGAVDRHAFQGNVAGVSADGERVAAFEGSRVFLWAPAGKREATYVAQAPVSLAEWSPRDHALAVVEASGFEVVDFDRAQGGKLDERPLVRRRLDGEPTSVRWDDGGLDLAICDASGHGAWSYLREGGRAKDDAPPIGQPCEPPKPATQPRVLRKPVDYEDLDKRELGPHSPLGGWRLGHHRFLTRDLVIFDAAQPAASRLLRFEGRDDTGQAEERGGFDSAVAVDRDQDTVAWEIAGEVRVYTLPDGKRSYSRKGHLLRRCSDGRRAGWTADKDRFQIFDVRHGGAMGSIPRDPAMLLGADSACKVLYTQRLDGSIWESRLDGGGARQLAVADGYVYDARPSPARKGVGAGLWIAASSGAIARIDEGSGVVRLAGYATPRATAVAEGALPGEVVYADAGGVVRLVPSRAGFRAERVLELSGESPWEDVSVAPDGASMLLVSADRIAALDVTRREIVGWIPVDGKSRFTRWDDEGSVIAWSFDRIGGAEGQVIPRGVPLAKLAAVSVSNLEAEKGRLGIHR